MEPLEPYLGLDPALLVLAAEVDDLEGVRIALENRYRRMVRPVDKLGVDGREYGLGWSEDDPTVKTVHALLTGTWELEKQAVREVEARMRQTPWWPWLQTAKGVGAKTLARLLAAIGDPRWNDLMERRRTMPELRSYCGMGVAEDGAAPRRKRGEDMRWNPEARKRLHVIADGCVRYVAGPSRFRDAYDRAKVHYADATHAGWCLRCAPSGHPAAPGSALSDGHRDGRARRAVGNLVLKELWLEARRLHGETVTIEPPAAGLRAAA